MTSEDSRAHRFEVSAEPREVEAFRRAIGLTGESASLPLTFPMRWLAAPDVRAALMTMVPEPDLVPVHESQAFEYLSPLTMGRSYTLTLAARREASPDRLVVATTIASAEGATHATGETILRLFSVAGPGPTEAEA